MGWSCLGAGGGWGSPGADGQTDGRDLQGHVDGLSPQRGSYVSTGQECTRVLRCGTVVSTAMCWQQPICWGTSAAGTLRSCRSSIGVLRGKRGDEEEELLHQAHGKRWLHSCHSRRETDLLIPKRCRTWEGRWVYLE